MSVTAVEQFENLIEKKISSPAMQRLPDDERRQKAILAVAKSNPQLHRAYLDATNQFSPRAKRLLAEKLG